MQTLNNSDFLNQALAMKQSGQKVDFPNGQTTEFQQHLLTEFKKGIPDNFNEFLMRKINQMQGLQNFEEFHLWFLFQMLICTVDQTADFH